MSEPIPQPRNVIVEDARPAAFIQVRDPETGLLTQKSIAITPRRTNGLRVRLGSAGSVLLPGIPFDGAREYRGQQNTQPHPRRERHP